jgi:hypothetical protein
LCLVHLGAPAEAAALVLDVDARHPGDSYLLQLAVTVWRALGDTGEARRMYERAVARAPESSELQHALLCWAIRDGDVKLQQAVASKLAQSTAQRVKSYVYWPVFCVLQRAEPLDPPSDASLKLVSLCESMLAQRAGREDYSAELALFQLDLLSLQRKHAAAVAFLESERGARLLAVRSERLRLLAHHLVADGRPAEAHAVWRDLLANHEADDYDAWLQLLDTSGDAVDAAVEFAALLHERGPAKRSPLLAIVERERRDVAAGRLSVDELAARVADRSRLAATRYVELYGSKQCCARDLHAWFDALPDGGVSAPRPAWVSVLAGGPAPDAMAVLVAAGAAGPSADAFLRAATSEYFRRLLAPAACGPRGLGETAALLRAYAASLPLLTGLAPSELGPADDLLALAASWLFGACADAPYTSWLVLLAGVLRSVCHKLSQNNSALKMLRLHCFVALGAGAAQYDYFQTLGARHILLDSMSYLCLGDLANTASVADASQLASSVLSAGRLALRESGDCFVELFEHSTLSKGLEFRRFRDRSVRSFQQAAARVELVYARLAAASSPAAAAAVLLVDPAAHATETGPAVASLPFRYSKMAGDGGLVDNRDWDVMLVAAGWGARGGVLRDWGSWAGGAPLPDALRVAHHRYGGDHAAAFRSDVARLALRSIALRLMMLSARAARSPKAGPSGKKRAAEAPAAPEAVQPHAVLADMRACAAALEEIPADAAEEVASALAFTRALAAACVGLAGVAAGDDAAARAAPEALRSLAACAGGFAVVDADGDGDRESEDVLATYLEWQARASGFLYFVWIPLRSLADSWARQAVAGGADVAEARAGVHQEANRAARSLRVVRCRGRAPIPGDQLESVLQRHVSQALFASEGAHAGKPLRDAYEALPDAMRSFADVGADLVQSWTRSFNNIQQQLVVTL